MHCNDTFSVNRISPLKDLLNFVSTMLMKKQVVPVSYEDGVILWRMT